MSTGFRVTKQGKKGGKTMTVEFERGKGGKGGCPKEEASQEPHSTNPYDPNHQIEVRVPVQLLGVPNDMDNDVEYTVDIMPAIKQAVHDKGLKQWDEDKGKNVDLELEDKRGFIASVSCTKMNTFPYAVTLNIPETDRGKIHSPGGEKSGNIYFMAEQKHASPEKTEYTFMADPEMKRHITAYGYIENPEELFGRDPHYYKKYWVVEKTCPGVKIARNNGIKLVQFPDDHTRVKILASTAKEIHTDYTEHVHKHLQKRLMTFKENFILKWGRYKDQPCPRSWSDTNGTVYMGETNEIVLGEAFGKQKLACSELCIKFGIVYPVMDEDDDDDEDQEEEEEE